MSSANGRTPVMASRGDRGNRYARPAINTRDKRQGYFAKGAEEKEAIERCPSCRSIPIVVAAGLDGFSCVTPEGDDFGECKGLMSGI